MDENWKDRLRQHAAAEKAKLKTMKASEKLDYIWTYYKLHMLGLLLVFGFFYLIGSIVYNSSFETVASIAVINDRSMDDGKMDDWKAELETALGLGRKQLVELQYGLSYTPQETSEFSYANMAKISALIASGSMDLVLTDPDTAALLAQNDAFMDVSEFVSAEQLASLEADGRIKRPEGSDKQSAIELDSAYFADRAGIELKPCYLLVMANTKKLESVQTLLDYWLRDGAAAP